MFVSNVWQFKSGQTEISLERPLERRSSITSQVGQLAGSWRGARICSCFLSMFGLPAWPSELPLKSMPAVQIG